MHDHPQSDAISDDLHLLAEVGMNRPVTDQDETQEYRSDREPGARDPHPSVGM
jgi:hypothetical protein